MRSSKRDSNVRCRVGEALCGQTIGMMIFGKKDHKRYKMSNLYTSATGPGCLAVWVVGLLAK